jgi:Transcriptional regulator PadR-like family.
MKRNILPLTFRVLHFLSTVKEATVDYLMQELKSEYGNEKQFRKPNVSNILISMKENGLIDDSKVELDKDGELSISYCINEEGSRLLQKYLPRDWKESMTA